jgi:Ca2+-transporting ATPase
VRSAWTIAWEQLTATRVVLLVVAAAVSVAVGDYKDALAIVVLNAMLGFYQEFQPERAIAALKKLAVPHVRHRVNRPTVNGHRFRSKSNGNSAVRGKWRSR